MIVLLVVDQGMWRDPYIVGPFADADLAREHVAANWPDMQPGEGEGPDPGDVCRWVDEQADDEVLLCSVASPSKPPEYTVVLRTNAPSDELHETLAMLSAEEDIEVFPGRLVGGDAGDYDPEYE